jgi:hypothetical protein
VKNQTGNALGMAAGFAVAVVFTGGLVVGAPLVLISMGVGLSVSLAYDCRSQSQKIISIACASRPLIFTDDDQPSPSTLLFFWWNF